MKFALFNQLQMPKPWRQNAEVLMYKEAIAACTPVGGSVNNQVAA